MSDQPRPSAAPVEAYFDHTPQPFGDGPPHPLVYDASPRALRQRTVNFAAKRLADMRYVSGLDRGTAERHFRWRPAVAPGGLGFRAAPDGEAELAAARTQLIQAQQAIEVSRANLSQFVGADPSRIEVTPASLVQLPPEQAPQPLNAAENPLMIEQNAAVEQARAQLHALERSYFPKFYLQGAVYARGSGAEVNGDRLGGVNGLAPNFQNYALGFSVTFPTLSLFGAPAPFAIPAARFNRIDAGGVFVIKVKDRSL